MSGGSLQKTSDKLYWLDTSRIDFKKHRSIPYAPYMGISINLDSHSPWESGQPQSAHRLQPKIDRVCRYNGRVQLNIFIFVAQLD